MGQGHEGLARDVREGGARRRFGERVLAALAAAAALAALAPAAAQAQRPPLPDPNFAVEVLPRPCAYEGNDPYERELYRWEGWDESTGYERYPGSCQRMRFSYGPIAVKPGQNDVLIGPVTIEKPLQDGFITRFQPNLVLADGTVPPVEQIHLHHGTWLSQPDYGSGPFFAAGEEKTVAPFPRGYGMPIRATDTWLLLYMVHSAVSQPTSVWITYDIDFVPQPKAEAIGLRPAYPVWLDVRPSGYPVFNVQRRYGGEDGRCTWPKEECAAFDPFGRSYTGQGQPGNDRGTDLRLPDRGAQLGRIESFQGGTLIGIGGHLHPGGLTNDIDLVRNGRSQRIYTGEALYWDRQDPSREGGPPTSWDFSMRVTGYPRWGVRVEPGDRLRSNATYDTTYQATYENMGIAVALLAPDVPGQEPATGVDPFAVEWDPSPDCATGGLQADPPTLCDRGGVPTHGHLPENGNYGGPQGTWDARPGPETNEVLIADFLYLPGDLSTASTTGVPRVKLGSRLRFTNAEGAGIYHTITTCRFPCLGATGAAFPLADGRTSGGRELDLDSSELGYGAPQIGPAKQSLTWDVPVTREQGFEPGESVTYFCRIHPSMRGAFEVTE